MYKLLFFVLVFFRKKTVLLAQDDCMAPQCLNTPYSNDVEINLHREEACWKKTLDQRQNIIDMWSTLRCPSTIPQWLQDQGFPTFQTNASSKETLIPTGFKDWDADNVKDRSYVFPDEVFNASSTNESHHLHYYMGQIKKNGESKACEHRFINQEHYRVRTYAVQESLRDGLGNAHNVTLDIEESCEMSCFHPLYKVSCDGEIRNLTLLDPTGVTTGMRAVVTTAFGTECLGTLVRSNELLNKLYLKKPRSVYDYERFHSFYRLMENEKLGTLALDDLWYTGDLSHDHNGNPYSLKSISKDGVCDDDSNPANFNSICKSGNSFRSVPADNGGTVVNQDTADCAHMFDSRYWGLAATTPSLFSLADTLSTPHADIVEIGDYMKNIIVRGPVELLPYTDATGSETYAPLPLFAGFDGPQRPHVSEFLNNTKQFSAYEKLANKQSTSCVLRPDFQCQTSKVYERLKARIITVNGINNTVYPDMFVLERPSCCGDIHDPAAPAFREWAHLHEGPKPEHFVYQQQQSPFPLSMSLMSAQYFPYDDLFTALNDYSDLESNRNIIIGGTQDDVLYRQLRKNYRLQIYFFYITNGNQTEPPGSAEYVYCPFFKEHPGACSSNDMDVDETYLQRYLHYEKRSSIEGCPEACAHLHNSTLFAVEGAARQKEGLRYDAALNNVSYYQEHVSLQHLHDVNDHFPYEQITDPETGNKTNIYENRDVRKAKIYADQSYLTIQNTSEQCTGLCERPYLLRKTIAVSCHTLAHISRQPPLR
jgi:hypothetical protein